MTCSICPHCGYDLQVEETVTDGRYTFRPREGLFFDGQKLKMTPAMLLLVSSLIRARGKILSPAVLGERLGYDGDDDVRNVVNVYVTRLRKLVPGTRLPIETVKCHGLRWVPQS